MNIINPKDNDFWINVFIHECLWAVMWLQFQIFELARNRIYLSNRLLHIQLQIRKSWDDMKNAKTDKQKAILTFTLTLISLRRIWTHNTSWASVTFSFIFQHTFSVGYKSNLQAGQTSTGTLFFHSYAFTVCTECGFALFCRKMHTGHWRPDMLL